MTGKVISSIFLFKREQLLTTALNYSLNFKHLNALNRYNAENYVFG
jgi:hypothetical protein